MEKILEKLEEYNIFNNLLPGIVFTYMLKYYVGLDVFQPNVIEMVFIYYFIGSLLSRFGSLILGEMLKKFNIIKYASHEDYINAAKKDKIIEKLLVSNNMYRTICSSTIILFILKLLKKAVSYFNISKDIVASLLVLAVGALYLFAYKKQTKHIVERIENEINVKNMQEKTIEILDNQNK